MKNKEYRKNVIIEKSVFKSIIKGIFKYEKGPIPL